MDVAIKTQDMPRTEPPKERKPSDVLTRAERQYFERLERREERRGLVDVRV